MWIFTTILLIIFIDQSSKFIISNSLNSTSPLPVISKFFYINLVKNSGTIFGLFQNATIIFIIISILAIVIVSLLLYISKRKIKTNIWFQLGLTLILAGAISNLIDRVRLGYVIDFLDFSFWPVFNIADFSITAGIIILALKLFRGK